MPSSSSSRRRRSGKGIVEESPSAAEAEATEPEPEPEPQTPGPSSSRKRQKQKSGRSSSKPLQLKTPSKKKREEDVCFVCFEGGNLVLCDHPGCPKAYHPACTNHDEAFFQSTVEWNCSWHVCRTCEKAAQYMCYTCTHALCKGCVKEAGFFCVRGDEGFCETCMKLVMSIENSAHANKETAKLDLHDENSWEYSFKCYWLDLKGKLSLTLGELTGAKNPWKESGVSSHNEKSCGKLHDVIDGHDSSSDSSSGRIDANKSTKRKMKKRSRLFSNEKGTGKGAFSCEGTSVQDDDEWASKELLELVARMRDGNIAVLSQIDVLLLLLEYIKRNNLRDPCKRSQVICDSMLKSLFGKARVGHAEMLKLLDSHFLMKENTDAAQIEADRNRDARIKMNSVKKRKTHKRIGERRPQTNLDAYASIDVHNINLIYLQRSLVEDLIDDMDTFHDKVVGSFVRIRILGMDQRQDMHRLVRVVGTGRAEETYNTGKKTTDAMLEILNLNETEVISIDTISDQDFSEEECNHFCQSIKSGLISRLTVGEVLEKAMDLQAVRVNNWLETELLQLSRIRDRANEKGRRKELRDSLDKIQLLSTPEERSRRLEELPEVHADPSLGPSFESDKDHGDQDNNALDHKSPSDTGFMQKGKGLASPGKGGSASSDGWNMPTKGKGVAVSSTISETDKIWHYQDPSGKTQGPFSMMQFRKWNKNGYFPSDLRIWKTSEGQEDSVLLTDELHANSQIEPFQWDPFQSFSQAQSSGVVPGSGEDNQGGGWGGTSSTSTDKQQNDGGWKSNWDSASGPANGSADGWATKSSGWAAAKTEENQSSGWAAAKTEENQSSGWAAAKTEAAQSSGWAAEKTEAAQSSGWAAAKTEAAQPSGWAAEKTEAAHSSGWAAAKTAAVNSKGGWAGSSSQGWESNDSNADQSSRPTTSFSGLDVEQPAEADLATGSNAAPLCGLDVTAPVPGGSMDIFQGASTDRSPNLTPDVDGEAMDDDVSAEKFPISGVQGLPTRESLQSDSGNQDPLPASVNNQAHSSDGWATMPIEDPNNGSRGTLKNSDKGWGLAKGNANTAWGRATEENTSMGWGTAAEGASTQGNANTGWGTATQGDTNSGTAKREASPKENANTGWGTATQETLAQGNTKTGWGAAMQGNTNKASGAAMQENTNKASGAAAQEASMEGNTNTGWGTTAQGNTNMGCGAAVQETSTEGNANAGWETSKGNTKTGWGAAMQGNTNKASGAVAQEASMEGNTNKGWGTETQGNTNTGCGAAVQETSPKGNGNTVWETSKGNTNTGSGAAEWETSTEEDANTGWETTKGNTNTGSGAAAWGTPKQETTNTGWGTATQGNANTGSGTAAETSTQGKTNTDWGTQGKTNTSSGTAAWETSRQRNTNTGSGAAAMETSKQANANTSWGSAAQGNMNTGWGTAERGNSNAGWGTAGRGDADVGWKSSAGNSDTWGSPQKNSGERFSGKEGGRGFQDGEARRGGERPSWNRQSSGREGGSSGMPPRGGQRVCKFHESGHCKKGASCNFLHA
ncbi:zinc finger CCCH domain-containing protein 19 [Magnolia sinica]|uniref:zinc finger CCCH domain-containing protein 19 n=1 Tax=Magnolia sinica TaxID=86752 RepID=UPI00265A980E|nr:zinc finger CCCH domain-containing protein 19 [Magnolia sinica]